MGKGVIETTLRDDRDWDLRRRLVFSHDAEKLQGLALAVAGDALDQGDNPVRQEQ